MNRLLNRAQWDESNDLTPVRIRLELMNILKVEWVIYLNIGFRVIQNHEYLHQFLMFSIADWTIEFASLRAIEWYIHR